MSKPQLGSHVAIVQPDARLRFNLAKFLTRVARYRLYVDDGGRRVTLEAITDEQEGE